MSQDETISISLIKVKEIEASILAKEKAEREKIKTKFDLKDLYAPNYRRSFTDYYPKKEKKNVLLVKSRTNGDIQYNLNTQYLYDLIEKFRNLIITGIDKPIKKYIGLKTINDNTFTIKAINK